MYGNNIYKGLIYFEDFYDKMDDNECRGFIMVLLDNDSHVETVVSCPGQINEDFD